MVKFINRCKVQVASGGTGTLTFGSAVASFESLTDQSVVDADQLRYTLEQSNEYEIGTGVIGLSGGTYTMTRTPLKSSNSDNSAIDASASAVCFFTMFADDVTRYLADLANVSDTSPSGGQSLTWDAAASTWKPASPSGGIVNVSTYANLPASPSVTDLAFVSDTKSLYIYDGTEWDRVSTGTNEVPEWTTEPPASASLSPSGVATTQTVLATDPEGFPIQYSYDTSPSNQAQATISQSSNTFTITPSTVQANAGAFTLRYKASDGLHSTARSTTYSLSFIPQISSLFGNWDIGNSSSYGGSGTTWNDLSGNGRNLTIENGSYNSSGFGGTPVWEWTNTDARIDLPDDLSSVKTYIFIVGLPTGSTRQIFLTADSGTYAGYVNSSSSGSSMSGGATHTGESRSSNMNGNAMAGGGSASANYGYMEANKLNIYALRGYNMNVTTTRYSDYSSYYAQANQLRAIFMWTTMLTDGEIKQVYDLFPTGSMATWDGA
tara:strand:+ start:989 stop:2464 length:1476 start_codon:yes stop_codon:yes gene_type:complete